MHDAGKYPSLTQTRLRYIISNSGRSS